MRKQRTRSTNIDVHLGLARQGSDSLNGRATTLVGFTGAIIALVARFSVEAMHPGQDLSDGLLVALAILLTVALAVLGLSVIFSVAAILPTRGSSNQLRKVIDELRWEGADARRLSDLTWSALDLQDRSNDKKSSRIRCAYVLAGSGISIVVVATALYAAALQA